MGNQSAKHEKNGLEGRDVRLDQRVSVQLAKGVKYNMKILIRGEVDFHVSINLYLIHFLTLHFSFPLLVKGMRGCTKFKSSVPVMCKLPFELHVYCGQRKGY